jgi:hypothetical protein
MRRCLAGDLIAAASAIAAADPATREALAQSLILQADAAHRYAKRLGRAHPLWGNGSLMSRALLLPPAAPVDRQSSAYLRALSLIAQLLAQRKSPRAPDFPRP